MADLADRAQEQQELEDELRQRKPYHITPGTTGDCDLCGEWSGRLIGGVCAPCRDKWRMK